MLILRPAPSPEFWCGSCSHSQISWRYHIGKVLPGSVITHSKTPQEYTNTGCGWDWLGWVGLGGDGWGWVVMGGIRMGAGRDSCGQQIVLFTFQLHFLRILRVCEWVLAAPGFRLGSDWAPWLHIDVLGGHFWCFKAGLWVSLGAF